MMDLEENDAYEAGDGAETNFEFYEDDGDDHDDDGSTLPYVGPVEASQEGGRQGWH